jgi:hypothetical protein
VVHDLALVSQLIANAGTRGGDLQAWSAGDLAAYIPGAQYRSKWHIDDSDGPLLFGLGIHGQYLSVDAARQLVVAKVSSQELPFDAARITATFAVRIGATARPGGLGFCAKRSRATAAYAAAVPAGGSNGPPPRSRPR